MIRKKRNRSSNLGFFFLLRRLWTILFVTFLSCGPSIDEQTKALDKRRMFKNNISSYIGRPIKYLILESNYKLKYFGYEEADAPFYLGGVSLTFVNDVKIFIDIENFRFEKHKNMKKSWDFNKCILEEAGCIKLMSDTPIVYKYFKQDLLVEYISFDSLRITDKDGFPPR